MENKKIIGFLKEISNRINDLEIVQTIQANIDVDTLLAKIEGFIEAIDETEAE